MSSDYFCESNLASALDVLAETRCRLAEMFLIFWRWRGSELTYEFIADRVHEISGDHLSNANIWDYVYRLRRCFRSTGIAASISVNSAVGARLEIDALEEQRLIALGLPELRDVIVTDLADIRMQMVQRLPGARRKVINLAMVFHQFGNATIEFHEIASIHSDLHGIALAHRTFRRTLAALRRSLVEAEAPLAIVYDHGLGYRVEGSINAWLLGKEQPVAAYYAGVSVKLPTEAKRPTISVPVYRHASARQRNLYGRI